MDMTGRCENVKPNGGKKEGGGLQPQNPFNSVIKSARWRALGMVVSGGPTRAVWPAHT
jgi:hypothetical protein